MEENDTVRLLRECDAGIKMGRAAIDKVMGHVGDERFSQILRRSMREHERLDAELKALLSQHDDDGKEPAPLAKGMSWLKTNFRLAADSSDETAADLITDGCNMGVKSLHRYLNQYTAADDAAKDLCRRLTELEEELAADIRPYL